MNDTQLVTELSAALDEAAASVRAPAHAAERAREQARARRLRRGLAACVPASALAVGLAIVLASGQAPAGHGGPGTRVQPAARLTAATVLDHAASRALAEPAQTPRPGQFVYTKTVGTGGGVVQTWRSADGTRNGFVLAGGVKTELWGCRHGWQTVRPDPGSGQTSVRQRCRAVPAYFPGMPVTASGLRQFLVRVFGPQVRNPAVAEKVTEVLLGQSDLRPAQRAALYRYFAKIPGLKLVKHVRDFAGRRGVGVSLAKAGYTAIWIFDPKTYAYLGSTVLAGGKVSFGSALLKVAVVGKAGQRPGR